MRLILSPQVQLIRIILVILNHIQPILVHNVLLNVHSAMGNPNLIVVHANQPLKIRSITIMMSHVQIPVRMIFGKMM